MSADYLLEEGSHTPPAAWDDFLSGTAAGVALTLVGHPFDTVKVRLQTQPALYKSGIQCCTDTIRKEGFFALYKGMGGPMLTVPLVNAIVFFGYGQAKSAMQRSQPADRPLSLLQISAAGACAGLLNTIVVSPVELIKTRLQIQHEAVSLRAKLHLSSSAATGAMTARPVEGGEKRVFEGPVDCVRKIVRQNGIKGLFRSVHAATRVVAWIRAEDSTSH
jgi:solute carrier family 25 carnitine/acylcarnitine transporter 20/29